MHKPFIFRKVHKLIYFSFRKVRIILNLLFFVNFQRARQREFDMEAEVTHIMGGQRKLKMRRALKKIAYNETSGLMLVVQRY